MKNLMIISGKLANILMLTCLWGWGCGLEETSEFSTTAPSEQEINDLMSNAFQLNEGGKDDSCSGVMIPDRAPLNKKIALTFDDGPHLTYTPRILDVLDKHQAKAIFFVNGANIRGDKEQALIKDEINRGHLVGNHSQDHLKCSCLSEDKFREQVKATDEILNNITSVKSKFFRYPFGAATCQTNNLLKAADYQYVGWHIDSADWCFANKKYGAGYCSPNVFAEVPSSFRYDFVGYVLKQAQETQGGVLLLHDVHQWTADNLDQALTALEKAGFTFVRIDDATSFPNLNGVTGNAAAQNSAPPASVSTSTPASTVSESKYGNCWSGGVLGSCIEKSTCAGKSVAGLCPGPWSVQCCIKN